ncbi:MAG: type II toxin-antitoxin system YafQ family toxin [Parvibaculales bacterium]
MKTSQRSKKSSAFSYELKTTSRFEKDLKRMKKRGADISKLGKAIAVLQKGGALPKRHKTHGLVGEWRGHFECHIQPDWLLIWKLSPQYIILVRTGTHSDLFKK